MFGGSRQVGTQGAEGFDVGEGAQAAGDVLVEFDHADVTFGGVVVERDSRIIGKAQIVELSVAEVSGQRVVVSLDCS